MEEKKIEILIFCIVYNNHTIRFIKNLKKVNPNYTIDTFTLALDDPIPQEILDNVRCCYKLNTNVKNRIVKLRLLYSLVDIPRLIVYFRRMCNKKYDIINIHAPYFYHSFIIKYLRRMSHNIILTPWGSDFYRIRKFERKILKRVYRKCDFITGDGGRFQNDIMRSFSLPFNKFKHLMMGSDTIDYIASHINTLSVEEAKEKIGLEDCYIITCGYNAQKAQRHVEIIQAINKVRDKLPSNIALVFPLTYGDIPSYRAVVKNTASRYGFKFKSFETYLSLEELYIVKQATDMFIHVQTTDANNSSLKEYLLLDKNVINGKWLSYPALSKDGQYPYHITESIEKLSGTIVYAFNNKKEIPESTKENIKMLGFIPWMKKWNEFFISLC